MKTCTKCGEAKSLDGFSPNRHMKSGRQSQCKACCANSRKGPDALPRPSKEQQLVGLRARQKRYYEAHREECNAKSRARYAKNRENENARRKQHYYANHAHAIAYANAYAERNSERRKAYKQASRLQHPWKKTLANKQRKLSKVRATPPWADGAKIAAVYEEAAFLRGIGVDVHVDHILPLNGKTVSGLHTHENLQVLLATDNLKKSNRVRVSVAD